MPPSGRSAASFEHRRAGQMYGGAPTISFGWPGQGEPHHDVLVTAAKLQHLRDMRCGDASFVHPRGERREADRRQQPRPRASPSLAISWRSQPVLRTLRLALAEVWSEQ